MAEETAVKTQSQRPSHLDLDQGRDDESLGTIRFEGATYNVLSPAVLGFRGMSTIEALQKRADAISKRLADNPDDEDALSAMESAIDRLIQTMLEGVTPEVVARIPGYKKMQIVGFLQQQVQAFSEARPKAKGGKGKHSR